MEGPSDSKCQEEMSLKDKGNELFKAGNYLKAAAVYTQAMKLDPSNPTLYSNRAAAFLHLAKLNKALTDADTAITLNPQWEKAYFRKGCILEAMQQYEDAMVAFETALQCNPHSIEISRKIKGITQCATDKKRALEVENMRSNVDVERHLDTFKPELLESIPSEELASADRIFSFIVDIMNSAIKSWHESAKMDAAVHFLFDEEETQTQGQKFSPLVHVDKAFESPTTQNNCFSFLRNYAEESLSRGACLVVPKSAISFPQVWKGQGSRKWKHGDHDGFFVQFESPFLRKLWFISSIKEKDLRLCRDPETLDVNAHQLLPRLFKQKLGC